MISDGSLSETLGVRILDMTDYFSFSPSLFFPFLSRNHLLKGTICLSVYVKKNESSGAFNQSFIAIPFKLTISRGFVKEKPQRLTLNIVREEP